MIFKNSLKVKHKKTGDIYNVIGTCINATNANDGDVMIIYQKITPNASITFVRERKEFLQKFESVTYHNLEYLLHESESKNSIFGHLDLTPVEEDELNKLPSGVLMYLDFTYKKEQ